MLIQFLIRKNAYISFRKMSAEIFIQHAKHYQSSIFIGTFFVFNSGVIVLSPYELARLIPESETMWRKCKYYSYQILCIK